MAAICKHPLACLTFNTVESLEQPCKKRLIMKLHIISEETGFITFPRSASYMGRWRVQFRSDTLHELKILLPRDWRQRGGGGPKEEQEGTRKMAVSHWYQGQVGAREDEC